jgi:prevent-host-death family protein
MRTWQLQEAKSRFSELVQKALDEGPQAVTRRGEEVVIVVPAAEYNRLTGRTRDFKEFLLSFPDVEGFEIERSREPTREIEL